MAFEMITSGRNKKQILIDGFRMKWNKGPKGPLPTTYFLCMEKGCTATLALTGDIDGDPQVKFHRIDNHNHRPDYAANMVSATLSIFRENIKANPDCAAKVEFELKD